MKVRDEGIYVALKQWRVLVGNSSNFQVKERHIMICTLKSPSIILLPLERGCCLVNVIP